MKIPDQTKKQNQDLRSISDKSKEMAPILDPRFEATAIKSNKSDRATQKTINSTNALADVDFDSPPSLGLSSAEEEEKEANSYVLGDRPITLETNSSVITITEKHQDNDGFTTSSGKKMSKTKFFTE